MRRTILSVLFSNFLGAVFGFLLNVLLARLLDVALYGRIAFIFSFIVLLFTVFEFGMTSGIVIFLNKKKKFVNDIFLVMKNIEYFFIRYLMFVVVCGILLLYLFNKYYDFSFLEKITIFVGFIAILVFRYLNSFHQALGKWFNYNFLNAINSILKFVFVISSVVFLRKFLGLNGFLSSLLGYIMYSLFLIVLSILVSRNYIFFFNTNHNDLDGSFLREFLKIVVPIGLSNVFIVVTMRVDSLIIEYFLGSAALGLYSAANTLALIFPLVTTSLMNVFLREASSRDKDFILEILYNQKKYIPYLIGILIISISVSKPIILFLFGEKFSDSVDIFRILLLAYIGGIFFTPLESFFYSHYPKFILGLKFFQMVLVIVGVLISVSYFGLIEVALVIVVSRVIGWIITCFAIFTLFKRSHVLKSPIEFYKLKWWCKKIH